MFICCFQYGPDIPMLIDICIFLAMMIPFYSKFDARFGFLVSENIQIDRLITFLCHLIRKIWSNEDSGILMAAILDFIIFQHVESSEKIGNLIYFHPNSIIHQNQVRNQF